MVKSRRGYIIIIAILCACVATTACSSGGGGGSTGGPITVSGTVVDHLTAPTSSADVVLNGDITTRVTTGVAGTFSFSNVTPPYTLTVKSGNVIREYRGLTLSNPLISTSTNGASRYYAVVNGTITGSAIPLPPNHAVYLGSSGNTYAGSLFNQTTGEYSAEISWAGGTIKTTDLAALHFSYSGSVITDFVETGMYAGINLVSGVTQSNLDFSLSTPVSTGSTIFNYSQGAYTTNTSGGYLTVKANGANFVVGGPSIASGTSVIVPLDGATLIRRGKDTDGNAAVRVATAVIGGTTTIDLPATTILKNSLPLNAETNVSTTPTLTWTPVSGAELYVVTLSSSSLMYVIYLPGSSTEVTIPDYSALGLQLAASTMYSWYVDAVSSGSLTANTAADPATGGLSDLIMYLAPSYNHYTSATTDFTTAP